MIWPQIVDWREPLVETLSWRTNVSIARDGTENRESVRVLPRRSFQIPMLSKDVPDALDSELFNRFVISQTLPEFRGGYRLEEDIDTGAFPLVTIPGALYKGFRRGQPALFVREDGTVTETTVTDPGFNGATFGDVVVESEGTIVYPGVSARMVPNIQTNRLSPRVAPSRSVWLTTTGQIWGVRTEVADFEDLDLSEDARPQLGSTEVLDLPVQYESGISELATRRVDNLDGIAGLIHTFDVNGVTRVTQTFLLVFTSQAEAWKFRRLLYRLRGRLNSLYVPMRHAALEYLGPDVGDNYLRFTDSEFADVVAPRDGLVLHLNDGSIQRFEISDIFGEGELAGSVPAGEEWYDVGTLSSPPTASDVAATDWLYLGRLASDDVEISWLSPTVAESSLTFTPIATGVVS